MQIDCSTIIHASRERIWQAITDWDHAAGRISAITDIEILERPPQGIVGLKWRETRTMFGKPATEEMWITEAKAPEYYIVGAESHGAVYETTFRIVGDAPPYRLQMTFYGEPQTFGARVMGALLGWMMKGATKKALQQDLKDIKHHLEAS